MKKTQTKAVMQMQDSYIEKFEFTTKRKVVQNEELELNSEIGFQIVNLIEKEDKYIAHIRLMNRITTIINDENIQHINVIINGLFEGSKEIEKTKFEEMLKLNGAVTLSHLVRAYINTMTSLSGNQTIITPMTNFHEFFRDENKK